MKLRIAFLLIVMACASSAFAQYQAPTNNGNVVVATCGTVPSDFPTSGQRAPNTIDTNGNTCTTPSSTGTENVNITKIGGYAVVTNGNGIAAVAGAASSGLVVSTAVGSGSTFYTTPVAYGTAVMASGSTSTIFTATTALDQGSSCINVQSAAVPLYLTDGNDVAIVPPGFSIPALSYLSFNDLAGSILVNGIKASAGSANAIRCRFRGKQ